MVGVLKRVVLGCAVIVLAAAGAAVALGLNSQESSAYEWSNTKWILDSVARDQRKLVLAFPAGGCTSDRGRAELEESRAFVRIGVQARKLRDRNTLCTAIGITGLVTVQLQHPLAGRRVLGASRIYGFEPLHGRSIKRGPNYVFLVPRVAGLALVDARRLLQAHGFRVHRLSRSDDTRRIAAGTQPPYGTPVSGRAVRVMTR